MHAIASTPEPGCYDLGHSRALLVHLAEPERALARMVAALRPVGAWGRRAAEAS